jgi:hypothetical protein
MKQFAQACGPHLHEPCAVPFDWRHVSADAVDQPHVVLDHGLRQAQHGFTDTPQVYLQASRTPTICTG